MLPSVSAQPAIARPVSHGRCAGGDPLPGRLALVSGHLLVALVALVAIGGATRVMEAGLACPDWPLCYGSFLPGGRMNLQVFLEWFHRLDAFVVGVGLLVLAFANVQGRRRLPAGTAALAVTALALVAVQGVLGALTVWQLLDAAVVTAHLGTALALVALLSGLHQRLRWAARNRLQNLAQEPPTGAAPPWWRGLALMALLLVLAQSLLGGAMASRWAADRCLADGVACGWLLGHRLGGQLAAAAGLLLAVLSLALPAERAGGRPLALAAALLLPLQVALGLAGLQGLLTQPLLTVAHQIVAALLVALLAAAATAAAGTAPLAAQTWSGASGALMPQAADGP